MFVATFIAADNSSLLGHPTNSDEQHVLARFTKILALCEN